jgi:perosamine synthetase
MDRMSDDVDAIIIVHMGGLITPDIYKIRDYCENNFIHLIVDAAHAHGSKYQSEYAGSIGTAGCFSFYPTKVMTTGEGGMITTNSKSLMTMARVLRNHGGDGNVGLYTASNDRMTEITAILGISQLKHLEEFVDKRNYISSKYRESLSMVSEIQFFPEYNEIKNSHYLFYFILNTINRKVFIEKMLQRGVQVGDAYTPPCHRQPVFDKYISNDTFEVADDILSRHVSLPMYTELNDKDIYSITDIVKEVISDCKK